MPLMELGYQSLFYNACINRQLVVQRFDNEAVALTLHFLIKTYCNRSNSLFPEEKTLRRRTIIGMQSFCILLYFTHERKVLESAKGRMAKKYDGNSIFFGHVPCVVNHDAIIDIIQSEFFTRHVKLRTKMFPKKPSENIIIKIKVSMFSCQTKLHHIKIWCEKVHLFEVDKSPFLCLIENTHFLHM